MGLLDALRMPQPKAGLAGAMKAAEARREAEAKKAEDAKFAAKAAAVPAAGADARAAANKLRPKIVQQHRQAAGLRDQLAEQKKRLAQQADAQAKLHMPDQAKATKARLADVEAKLAAAQRIVERLGADLAAIDDPATSADVLNRIGAAHKSGSGVAKSVQAFGKGAVSTELGDDKLVVSRTDRKDVTSELAGGTAKSDTRVEQSGFELGRGGDAKLTSSTTRTQQQQTGDTSVTKAKGESVSVGTDGLGTRTTDKKTLVGADGNTRSVEKTDAFKVSASGFENQQTRTETKADGSAVGTGSSGGFERGDGKAFATRGKSTTLTDAKGTETTTSGKAKGGLIAGEDGTGVGGGFDGGIGKKRASGIASTADIKLVAGLVCDIVEVEGSDPPRYRFKLQLDLGAAVEVASGYDKEGASAKGGAKAKAGKAVFLRVEKELDEKAAAAYKKGLADASSKQKVTLGDEFEVIRAFAVSGAAGARQVYAQLFGDGSAAATLATMKAGETRTAGDAQTLGGEVSGNVKAVGVKLGAQQDKSKTTTLAKGSDGSLLVNQDENERLAGNAEVTLSSGLVSGSFGKSAERTTSKGLKIEVPAQHPKKSEMEKRLLACKSQADLDRFAADFPDCVERSRGEGQASGTGVGIGVAGLNLGIQSKKGSSETEVRDGKGNLKQRTKTGSAGRGGSLGPLGDSVDENLTATTTGDGDVRAQLTRKTEAESIGKQIDAKLDAAKRLLNPTTLADVTGGNKPADTKIRTISGLSLKKADLVRLGQMAVNKPRDWMRGCTSPQALADWQAACDAVREADGAPAAVADALAEFVGRDEGPRLLMVNRWLRPDGKVATGQRTEFPEGLTNLAPIYQAAVVDDPHDALQALVDAGDAKKAKADGDKLLAQLQMLDGKIKAAQNFARASVRDEMLSAIADMRSKVGAVLRKLDGAPAKPVEDHDSAEFKDYMAFVKVCVEHEMTQVSFIEKLREMSESYTKVEKKIAVLSQWRDLLALWERDYARLEKLAITVGKKPVIYEKQKPSRKWLDEWEGRILINR